MIVGEAQYLLIVGIVPLHRYVHGDIVPWSDSARRWLKNGRVQYALALVDVFQKPRVPPQGKQFFLAGALVRQLDAYPLFRKDSSRIRLGQIS